jgi:chaperone modulatory protein CbpM
MAENPEAEFEGDVLDANTLLSLEELAHACNVDITWIESLHAQGVISESDGYTVLTMTRLRKARRLEVDLGLNTEGLAVVLDLLDQIDQLHSELARHKLKS